jgi:Cd(II)/Pb(II)-responsive transcriptional regulator
MRIKDVSEATGVPSDTIRHYEKAGLLPLPARAGNNYRRYTEADVQRLRFIRNCRSLDMSLDEVRPLLDFLDHPQADCSKVDAVIEGHLAHVRERLASLQVLERQLELLTQVCGQQRAQELCGIVMALSKDAPGGVPPTGRGVHTT